MEGDENFLIVLLNRLSFREVKFFDLAKCNFGKE